jgi:AcrR family transcriptional regulator
MAATWCALCARGYADLTMQAIADESSVSKAALHYHYDSKQDLLEAFLDHAADRFLARLQEAAADADDPADRLDALVDAAVSPSGDDREGVSVALLELQAQAPHEPPFRERLRGADEAVRDLLADVLAAGVERGTFRPDLDPETAARTIVTVLEGGRLRQVSLAEDPETVRALLESYLDAVVYAEGQQ